MVLVMILSHKFSLFVSVVFDQIFFLYCFKIKLYLSIMVRRVDFVYSCSSRHVFFLFNEILRYILSIWPPTIKAFPIHRPFIRVRTIIIIIITHSLVYTVRLISPSQSLLIFTSLNRFFMSWFQPTYKFLISLFLIVCIRLEYMLLMLCWSWL